MPAISAMRNTTSLDGSADDGAAPTFIVPLAWIMLLIPVGLVVIGVLYGLRRFGTEEEAEQLEGDDAQRGAFHTARGARGWDGQNDESTELHALLHAGDDSIGGDGDSETTAVEGNIQRADLGSSPAQTQGAAAGQWKLKREGFSTTAAPASSKSRAGASANGRYTPNGSRIIGASGRTSRHFRAASREVPSLPPSSNKDD